MPPILADVTFSTDSLAVVTAVVGALSAAVVALWRQQWSTWAAERDDLRRQRDALLRVLYRLDLADEVPPEVPHGALPPPDTDGY